MQFDSRYQRLSETRGRWPGRETNGQALDGAKRQREHRLELLLFLLLLLFLIEVARSFDRFGESFFDWHELTRYDEIGHNTGL